MIVTRSRPTKAPRKKVRAKVKPTKAMKRKRKRDKKYPQEVLAWRKAKFPKTQW